MTDVLRNIFLGISLAAPIGPASVAVIQNGLKRGFLRAFLIGIGVTMADTTFMLIVYFGLAQFISIPLVKIAIWSLGALVLVYLGIQSIRDARRKIDFEQPAASTDRNPVLVGYLVNISNPIAVVWWLGIFGSLLGEPAGGSARSQALFDGLMILVGILSWHCTMSVLTHWGKRLLNEKTTRYISWIAGSALILFGIRFGWNALQSVLMSLKGG